MNSFAFNSFWLIKDTFLFTVMTPTTRKATGNHLGYHRLRDEIPMEGDGQHQNEEQRDFQMTQQG